MNCLGLIELSDPVSFDPVGPVTSVFYDDKNQQVFSVRSGGATGIVVKSPGRPQKTFVLEDKGPILTIKLSPDQKVLSIQRKTTGLDFHNIESSGQLDVTPYLLSPKNKTSPILGFLWTGPEELVTLSDVGLDIYSLVTTKKIVKYLRSSSTSICWFVSCPLTNLILTANKQETSSLQVWSIKSSNIIKLPGIDLGSFSSSVREKDVSLINLYSQSYIRVNIVEEGVVKSIHLYSTENDQVILVHQLTVNVHGSLGLQTLDNLILVHSLQESSTQVFDIAVAKPKVDGAAAGRYEPVLPRTSITGKGSCSPLQYSPTWVLVLPSIILDARNGHMWTLGLRLKRAECVDPVDLCRFYLHRTGGKQHVLSHMKQTLRYSSATLHQFSRMFREIMVSYYIHHNKGDYSNLPQVGFTSQQCPRIHPVVVLDQSEIFTSLLAPAEKEGVSLERLQGVLVELLLTLSTFKFPARQFILEMFINLSVKTAQYYQMHQYIQYGVIPDSKHLACIILSLESVYPPARMIALDMMSRMGNAVEELIEICIAEGKVIQAINIARDRGLVDAISARKYLEATRDLETLTFFHAFSFFEERNVRLRGTPRFAPDEKCEMFVEKFKQLF